MNNNMDSVINKVDFPEFEGKHYAKISMNELVTYAAFRLAQTQNEITAENLVAAGFYLFPQKFFLRGYSHWPDSTVINKRWLDCRSKGYISGSTAKGFSVTPNGISQASKTHKKLIFNRNSNTKDNRVLSELRTRAGRFVHYLEDSDAYKVYSSPNEEENPTEFDMRLALQCSMESPKVLLASNLELLRQYVDVYNRGDLQEFLNYISNELRLGTSDITSKSATTSRGMLPKKD